jgi:Derlin-2/3
MSGPGDWYNGLPPITKFFGTACVATTIAMEFNLINPFYLVLDWGFVFRKFQVWRLLTCFFVIGGFSWNFLMRIILIHNYGVALEKGVFQFKTAEFLTMLFFGAAVLMGFSLALPSFNLVVLNGPFVFMLLYVWSKHYPTQNVSIMGLFQVKGFYLPWAFLMINMVMGGSPWMDLFGILAGHLHYFLTELNQDTRRMMEPPHFVHKFIAMTNVGHPSQTYQQQQRPAGVFRGRGQRLGGN